MIKSRSWHWLSINAWASLVTFLKAVILSSKYPLKSLFSNSFALAITVFNSFVAVAKYRTSLSSINLLKIWLTASLEMLSTSFWSKASASSITSFNCKNSSGV